MMNSRLRRLRYNYGQQREPRNRGTGVSDDHTLIVAAQKGDRPAFEAIIQRHQGAIYGYLRARLLVAEDAEDLCQEVFLRCYTAQAHFDSPEMVRPWLIGIARNLLRERVRRVKRRREVAWTELCLELEELVPDCNDQHDDACQQLPVCLDSLGTTAREAIDLQYRSSMRLSAIGDRLRRSEGAIKLLLFRARQGAAAMSELQIASRPAMTDKELIALIETKLPQELSLEEIGRVRERLRESSAVRQALAGRLQLDQYLCATVGHIELSADAIFAAGRANRFRRTGLGSWFGWGVCLLLVGFVVSMLVWPLIRGPAANNENVAQAGKDPTDPNRADALAKAKVAGDDKIGVKGGGKDPNAETTSGDPNKNSGKSPRGHDNVVTPDAPPHPDGGPKFFNGPITINAAAPTRSAEVDIDREKFGRGIGGVIVSVGEESFVEYDVLIPVAGTYQLELRYAIADGPRPLRVSINGKVVKEDAALQPTKTALPADQQMFPVGDYPFQAGKNTIRLVPRIPVMGFPYLNRLILTRNPEEPPAAAKGPPWEAKDQLAGAPRAIEQIAFEAFDRPDDLPSQADLQQWFTSQPGAQIEPQNDPSGQRPLAIDGPQRFNGPWKEDTVLRLSLDECQRFAIHFWKGKTGAMLRLYSNQKWALVAYTTRRNGAEPIGQNLVTTASDESRNWQTGSGSFPMRFDLRFRKGELIVSRGEVVLLRAPFDGLPSETYFDGHCRVRGLAMAPAADDLPAEPELLAIAADIARPAELPWEGKAIAGVEFKRLDDGSVELKAQGAQDFGWHWCDLPKQGFYEVEMELDGVTPGARVAFGMPRSEPRMAVGFFTDGQAHGIACRLASPGDRADRHDPQPDNQPAAYSAGHQWIRLIGSCGMLKCYGSADGIHWARFAGQEDPMFAAPIGRIGLGCVPTRVASSIRLRRVTLREFSRLSKLASSELVAKARLSSATNFSDWLADIGRQQPQDVAPDVWRRACALRSLSSNAPAGLGRDLLAALFDDSLGRPTPIDERLRLLDEMALWTNVCNDAAAATAFANQYERLGAELARDNRPAWFQLTAAAGRAPIWCDQVNPVAMDSLFRTDLIRQIYAGNVEQVRENLAWLRLLNGADSRMSPRADQAIQPLVQWTLDWLAAWRLIGAKSGDALGETAEADDPTSGAKLAVPGIEGGGQMIHPFRRRLRPRGPAIDQSQTAGRVERRHPLIEESNKEGFSMLAEFESALDGKEYRDACRTITSGAAFDMHGLLPDPHDPELFVSFDLAVDTAMRRDAALRETMIRQFGPLGMLQVRRAMNEQDAAAVASATIRYRGTEAAGEALVWLGDRALSGGDFHAARTCYRQALRDAGPSVAERVAPRDRMAAAMLGIDAGHPATGAVTLGEVQLGAAEFESMVAEMRRTHASSSAETSGAGDEWNAPPVAPAPGGFDVRELARFDGNMGADPANVGATLPARGNSVVWQSNRVGPAGWNAQPQPRETRRELDWAARQLATARDDARLYVSNRFQVIAYDLKTGSRQWQTPVPDPAKRDPNLRTHDWTLTPMRPLPVARRVFVRRLTTSGPELASLTREKGIVEWHSLPGLLVVSDPVSVGGELLAITAVLDEPQPGEAIDPRLRGRVVFIGGRQVPIAQPPAPVGFQPVAFDQRNVSWKQTSFQLTAFDPESGQVRRQQRIATMNEGWGQQAARAN